jgi:hypothetical protein
MTIALPLACYYALNNKTIDVNYVESSTLYKLDIKSIHIDKVKLGKPIFEQIAGT